jgi:hypothetical protein
MGKILDVSTISQVEVIETLRNFIMQNYSADIANDAVYEFTSELTGISVDQLAEYVEGY